MSKVAFKTNTTMVYINQIRASMAMMGSAVTTPGGNALKFYASLRLSTMQRQESTTPGAFKMRVKVIKNKNAPPRKDEVEFDFLYAKGPEPYQDLITAAKECGVIRFAGPTSFVKWDGKTEEKLATGGKDGIKVIIQDPDIYQRLRLAVLATANPLNVIDTPEDTDPPEEDNERNTL
jgi:recombination protein RecA